MGRGIVNPIAISGIIFACVFGGALLGLLLRAVLPEHHLSTDTKDVVKVAMGMVGTMAALVLGLLVASAKGSYDTQSGEVTQMSANMVLLDRALAHYGAETQEIRTLLKRASERAADQLWSAGGNDAAAQPTSAGGEVIYDKMQALTPQTDGQRTTLSQAISFAVGVAQTRWLLFEQRTSSLSVPLLIVVVFWLTIMFVSFGVFAPQNGTVLLTLFVCALSVSGAIFLVLELNQPFSGLIRISDAPMRRAIAQLGQ